MAAAAALTGLGALAHASGAGAPQRLPGYVRGDVDAPVTVIEFGDFGCPYCAQFAAETSPQLHDEFVATGLVKWICVPFVMGNFPNGDQAALAAECAAEAGLDAFWRMYDELYRTQRTWRSSRTPDSHMQDLARNVGLDAERFAACLPWRRRRRACGRLERGR